MKIVVLGTRGFPNVQGGVETHCEHLYPFLAQEGCDVTVLTRTPYVDPGITSYKNVKLIARSCPKNKFLEAIVHTVNGVFTAKKLGCDIVHFHAIGPSLCAPLARLLGLKTVMTHHGPDYMRKKWNLLAKAILKAGENLGCLWANRIICISDTIADNIRKKFKKDPMVIPNGVIIPELAKTSDALHAYGLEKEKYILTVGRFVPEKGFHDLINAYSLKLKTNKIKLVIVGDADHQDKYSRDLKESAGGNKDIILTGRLTGKPLQELYSHAGLFILPSYYEGLPIVLLEAMSYGLSCIISDIPANREVALENQRHFSPGDIEGMSAKIQEYIDRSFSQEEKYSQIENIKKNYDWKKIAKQTKDVYKKILRSTT